MAFSTGENWTPSGRTPFFWAYEEGVFEERTNLAAEAQMVHVTATSIKIPQKTRKRKEGLAGKAAVTLDRLIYSFRPNITNTSHRRDANTLRFR